MLKSITMTADQTAVYDGADEAAIRHMLDGLRSAALALKGSGDTVEIYTADGIVADVVQ